MSWALAKSYDFAATVPEDCTRGFGMGGLQCAAVGMLWEQIENPSLN